MPHDVYISFTIKDKAIADMVSAKLEESDLRCWIAPRDILAGCNYAESVKKAIDESRVMVLIFSSQANISSHVQAEVERAVHNGIPVIPVRIEDVEPSEGLSYFLRPQHWLDAMPPPLERHITILADTLKVLLGEAEVPQQSSREKRGSGLSAKDEVFISYADEDNKIAAAVCAQLEERRVRCWIAPRNIHPSEKYGDAIIKAIDSAKIMVLVFSSHANASSHVMQEAERAVHDGIPIIPFRIEDVQPSPSLQYYIGPQHWLDALTPPLEAHIHRLAETIGVLEWQICGRTDEIEIKETKKMIKKENTSLQEVFISFKNLDASGNETRDSEMARTIALLLRDKGLNVFFSLDSLEKLGESAYKKAIDDALDRATILIAVGTSREHLSSDWVRYEWDGFLQDIIEGVKPEGRIFTVIEGLEPKALPRGLRQQTVFLFNEKDLLRMTNYIRNAT